MACEGPKEGFFNPEIFVQNLLDEGSKIPCDETSDTFTQKDDLPAFYDKNLYKNGQKFFYDNIFSLLFGKFLGLVSVLAVPSIRRILMYTKMSGTSLTAYRRYLATLFHMVVWYQDDFRPGSRLWASIKEVKRKHNSASKKSCSAGLPRISQTDMALTQFGFMGFALANPKKLGLFGTRNEDLRCLVHIWRVIGHVMGIEDRFNICRDSIEETAAICKTLSEQIFRPAVAKKEKDFVAMASYLCKGMWAMNPTLNSRVYLNLLHRQLQEADNNNVQKKNFFIRMNLAETFWYYFLIFTIWTLQFRVVKIYHNYTQYLSLWLMKVFPFLAYYSFGYENSHVKILDDSAKSN